MDKFWDTLYRKIESGSDVVLATITASRGSVPRGSGARMLVDKSGLVIGTVGGGAVEYECIKIAGTMLKEKSSTCGHFYLDKNEIQDIGMICGGDVEILFHYVSCDDKPLCALFKKIAECERECKSCMLYYSFSKNDDIAMKIQCDDKEYIGSKIDNPIKEYSEEILSSEKVYIFGGGHVARSLVPILAMCDFNCVVIEDRPEHSDAGLFGNCCDIILVSEGTLSDVKLNITKNDYVCIMTRGHKDDYRVQAQVLKSKACYIGVIGSRRKIAAVNERLMSDGFTKSDIERITTPIGIDIKSETPAEIAVSIAAQLIMVRAQKRSKV